MDIKIGPLEELAELTDVMYLSDLQNLHYEIIRTELGNIDPEEYTLEQWKDAAKYLTGNDIDMETVEEIYEYLMTY